MDPATLANVREFVKDAERLLRQPPRAADQLGLALAFISEYIGDVNVYAHHHIASASHVRSNEWKHVVALMRRLIDELFFATLCDHYPSFIDSIPMDFEHPSSGAMLLFVNIAHLVNVMDSVVDYEPSVDAGQFTCFAGPASALPRIARECLVVSQAPIAQYAISELLNAAKVLAARWYRLSHLVTEAGAVASRELSIYLQSLIYRGCMLMARPGKGKTRDMETMRAEVGKDGNDPIYKGNYDLLRRLSGGLLRMFIIARFRLNTPRLPYSHFIAEADELQRRCDKVRAALAKAVESLKLMPTIKTELKNLFLTSGMWFGDLDVFREKCDNDRANELDVIFNAKPPDVQQAWMHKNQAIQLDRLCQLREGSPHYFQMYDYLHHYYAQNLKLYAAASFFTKDDVKLLTDLCVAEQDFFDVYHVVINNTSPTILSFMGASVVYYHGKVYECISTEHALLTWALIIQRVCGGKIHMRIADDEQQGIHRDIVRPIGDSITKLLNEDPVYAVGDKWKGKDYISGRIDD